MPRSPRGRRYENAATITPTTPSAPSAARTSPTAGSTVITTRKSSKTTSSMMLRPMAPPAPSRRRCRSKMRFPGMMMRMTRTTKRTCPAQRPQPGNMTWVSHGRRVTKTIPSILKAVCRMTSIIRRFARSGTPISTTMTSHSSFLRRSHWRVVKVTSQRLFR